MARTSILIATVVTLLTVAVVAQSAAGQSGVSGATNNLNSSGQEKQSPNEAPALVVYKPSNVSFTSEQADFRQNTKDILFDYNSSEITPDAQQNAVTPDAQWLKSHPDVHFYIDGYADWRGNVVYNVILAGERAQAVQEALVQQGVSPEQIRITAGWGKLYPLCADQDESCWQQNRRVHLTYAMRGSEAQTSSGGR